jgi:protoporphyrinogen oxidase
MRVGIIGAGAAGLAAAFELGKRGHEAIVHERAPFVGGQASTFDVGGQRLERGYHHLFTSDTDIVELIEEIGLGHQMRWVDSKVGTFHGGKIYDFVTPMDLLKFTPLSLVDRLRLGLVTLYLQRRKSWRELEAVTAVEWLRKHAGERVYDVFWGPMLRGKFGEKNHGQVAMAWVWGKVQSRVASRGKSKMREKLGYPVGSFGEVFDVLAQRIEEQGGEVHIGSSVSRIVLEDGRATGMELMDDKEVDGGKSRIEPFDAVIATTPSYIFPRLVPSLPEEYLAKLAGVNYMAAVLIILVLDRPLSRVYWLNVADRSLPFVGVIEHTNLIPSDQYGGNHIVYLSNYVDADHPFYKMDHEELLQEYTPHLRKINPEFDTSWIRTSYHHRVDAAQPIIGTHYSERMPDHRTPFRGLYLANTTQIYPEDRGTNYSVRMGRHVARMAMEDLE